LRSVRLADPSRAVCRAAGSRSRRLDCQQLLTRGLTWRPRATANRGQSPGGRPGRQEAANSMQEAAARSWRLAVGPANVRVRQARSRRICKPASGLGRSAVAFLAAR
jgi:hypothetical protein